MIELNAGPLPAELDIFSLIPAGTLPPALSANESATPEENFSALLTELTGAFPNSDPEPFVSGFTPAAATANSNAGVKPATTDSEKHPASQISISPDTFVPFVVVNTINNAAPQPEQEQTTGTDTPLNALDAEASLLPPALASNPAPFVRDPEADKVWSDVKKFEITVLHETVQPLSTATQPAADSQETSVRLQQAMITTDPVVNLQQQLLPRIAAISKTGIDVRLPERSKASAASGSASETHSVTVMPFADSTRTPDQVEQARPAQPVEIPVTPHLQVVRTVAMEVGDSNSQVVIRIEERGGDVTLQMNTASEALHHELQSSVGSLVHALKQEDVPVSNIEVSRKSPIEKVRRMKEAH